MIQKIFTSPINLIVKIGEKVQEEVEKELYDLEHIQKKLIHLQMMYELEEIDEDSYKQSEKELLIRYEIAKKREMEQINELTKRKK
ncbi:gas vesicle protein GvpG [Oceanobacillus profundus]|uniref:Gas vesicle protein GvpG n=1 Tax=Oceanobacillus profundus TaxID=372463 RepID=A0A417YAM3_9BACI|nr:gas vesicle protein GvpG [Oceanobacillus profundus]MBR3119897.1 gas vesicle protein GvpG [Oceanobacillus sp.]PAE27716.1 gas vesicle protein GvpG [Paenibacillus sp. 7884-2]MCM3397645.1 gas vesicle protein GvpG [Oceanobacillus profundus]MDO6448468.1 gas vesicle protein GvpG [Oceanobacillus profundus]RHW29733.1 gas vesicle protein GvpG [Oceanobacillus profundus]